MTTTLDFLIQCKYVGPPNTLTMLPMPGKARIEDSIIGRLLSRYSLLRRRAHGGSLLQTCAPKRHSY